jgi:7,8-dihydropterin-6-yl-methyl-4-(beta-D-ribofuranosyl)aminobenzene 5'-phosphate synthase
MAKGYFYKMAWFEGLAMKWGSTILLIVALFLLYSCAQPEPTPNSLPSALPLPKASLPEPTAEAGAKLRLTIVYDNNEYDSCLETKWGFSCLVEGLEKTILFDTGADSATLLSNMKKLKIDPAEVDAVMLSHIHGDHVGGLSGFLEENSGIIVCVPKSFPDSFKDRVRLFGAEVEEVSEAKELFTGVYTTGELGNGIKEQSLIVTSSQGLVVITGCAHPGVVNIVRKAKDLLAEKPVYLVIGGFHLAGAATPQIESVIEGFRQLGVRKVAPCHCSGDETRKLFKEEYGEDYVDSGAGKTITLP